MKLKLVKLKYFRYFIYYKLKKKLLKEKSRREERCIVHWLYFKEVNFCRLLSEIGPFRLTDFPELIKHKPSSTKYIDYWYEARDINSRLKIINKILSSFKII